MTTLDDCGRSASPGTMVRMEDVEATRLMLEALFVIRAKINEIHAVVVGGDDEDEEEEEEDA